MELNWSTFILEIINFLILVWILKHFFYKPVLKVISKRREAVEKTLTDAKTLHEDAETLREQYKNRLAEWKREKQAAQTKLEEELGEDKARQVKLFRADLEQERQIAEVANQRKLETAWLRAEETALDQGAKFAARLLSAAAGKDMEKYLINLLIKDLSRLPPDRVDELRAGAGAGKDTANILVSSAYPLDQNTRAAIEKAMTETLGMAAPFHYTQEKSLLAGLCITVGSWVLRANLRDELKAFADLVHES